MHSPASNTLPRYSQLPVDHYRSHFNTLGLLGIEDRNAHTLTKMDDLVVYVNESIESEGHVQYFSERLALWQLLSTNLKDLIGIIQKKAEECKRGFRGKSKMSKDESEIQFQTKWPMHHRKGVS